MKIAQILLSTCLVLFLSNCTKVEDSLIVPNTLPYTAYEFTTFSESDENYLSAAVLYNDIKDKNVVHATINYKDPSEDRAKGLCIYSDRDFGIHTDQVNFINSRFPGLERILLFPYMKDVNNNGLIDRFFLLWYPDSLVVGALDSQNDDNESWIYRTKFDREDNHYLRPLAVWEHPKGENYMMIFRKSNRIKGVVERVDTLFCLNLKDGKVKFKVPIGAAIWPMWQYLQCGPKLILNGRICENGITYKGLDDYHSYIIAMDDIGNIDWLDTLTNDKIINGISFLLHFNEKYVIATKTIITSNVEKTYIIKYNLSDGTILSQQEVDINMPIFKSYIINDKVCFLAADKAGQKLRLLDENLQIIAEYTYSIPISTFYSCYGSTDITQTIGQVFGQTTYDINNDGTEDIIAMSSNNQVIIMSGKSLEPLLGTKDFGMKAGFCFMGTTDKVRLVVATKSKLYLYDIIETPFLDRFKPFKVEIFLLCTAFLFLPLAYYLLRKIQYHRGIFRVLTSESESQGIIVFDKNGKAKSSNQLANEIFGIKGKTFNSEILPEIIRNSLDKASQKNSTQAENSNFSFKYKIFNYSIIPIKMFGIGRHFLLILNDITNAINDQKRKNELKTAVGVAHGLKTPLGTILLRFEVLQNMVLNNYTEPEIQKSKELILKNINLSRDTIRQISYIAKEMSELPKDNYSLKELLENWIENYSPRYNNYNIDIRASLSDNLPELKLNPKSIELLMLTACDNSMQAMPKSRVNKLIELKLEQNNGNVLLSIIDNGSGMTADTLKKVQENTGYTSKATGSGLGMQLIRKVCHEHGANFILESEQDKGTTLKISFNINGERNE